jgi:SAM-dependent methyltransferase
LFDTEPEPFMPTRLNLGCGRDRIAGAVNLDLCPLPEADVAADANRPLPFIDSCFDEVLCFDVLEHVDDLTATLREVHRVTKPGGAVRVRSCHFSSRYLWEDPTHKRGFSFKTFDFYCRAGTDRERDYYFDFAFAGTDDLWIDVPKGRGFPLNPAVERFINRSHRTRSYYEAGWMRALFPAGNVSVTLRKSA